MTKENQQKGKLHMDTVVATLWPHKEYLGSMEEDISLLGISKRMPDATLRVFVS